MSQVSAVTCYRFSGALFRERKHFESADGIRCCFRYFAVQDEIFKFPCFNFR